MHVLLVALGHAVEPLAVQLLDVRRVVREHFPFFIGCLLGHLELLLLLRLRLLFLSLEDFMGLLLLEVRLHVLLLRSHVRAHLRDRRILLGLDRSNGLLQAGSLMVAAALRVLLEQHRRVR